MLHFRLHATCTFRNSYAVTEPSQRTQPNYNFYLTENAAGDHGFRQTTAAGPHNRRARIRTKRLSIRLFRCYVEKYIPLMYGRTARLSDFIPNPRRTTNKGCGHIDIRCSLYSCQSRSSHDESIICELCRAGSRCEHNDAASVRNVPESEHRPSSSDAGSSSRTTEATATSRQI